MPTNLILGVRWEAKFSSKYTYYNLKYRLNRLSLYSQHLPFIPYPFLSLSSFVCHTYEISCKTLLWAYYTLKYGETVICPIRTSDYFSSRPAYLLCDDHNS